MDDLPSVTASAALERRAIWLMAAAGLLLLLRGNATVLLEISGRKHYHLQLWLYIASMATLGAAAIAAGFVVLPDLIVHPNRIATRWNPVRLLGWSVLLLVVGLAVTAVSGIVAGADALSTNPFGG